MCNGQPKLEELKGVNRSEQGKVPPRSGVNWVVQRDVPHNGLKEHAAVDTNHGFILATTMTPASINDNPYLPYCTVYSHHTNQPIEKVFTDKPNRDFLAQNPIADGKTKQRLNSL